MKKTVKAMLTVMLAASLILIFGSCSSAEPVEVSGTLTNAVDKQITVRTDDGPVVFKTEDDTVYNLGGESELIVGDTVKVKYHKSMGKDHVDEVTAEALASMNRAKGQFDATSSALTTRMNSIAGQATSDTEILDARVDAFGRTFENLGEALDVFVIAVKLIAARLERAKR